MFFVGLDREFAGRSRPLDLRVKQVDFSLEWLLPVFGDDKLVVDGEDGHFGFELLASLYFGFDVPASNGDLLQCSLYYGLHIALYGSRLPILLLLQVGEEIQKCIQLLSEIL